MIRPNLAMDAPPMEITVGGAAYKVDVDYCTWIEVTGLMRRFTPNMRTEADVRENALLLVQIETKVFGKYIEAPFGDVLAAITQFAKGYPQPPVQAEEGGDAHRAQTYSFDYDINAIVIAIRSASGLDISYRRKEPFHWWLFLEEFRHLAGDHEILKLIEVRGYSGKDRELQKAARRYALPHEQTAEEREILAAFDRLCGGDEDHA